MLALAIIMLASMIFIPGCAPAPHSRQISGTTWGTTFHITYTSPTDLSATALEQMQLIDSTLSMFNPSSEVSRINAARTPIPVSDYFKAIFALSQKIHTLSHGTFDPTVAPLVDIWGFGRKAAASSTPDSTQIALILERVGLSDCEISPRGLLIKKHPFTEFDFSAIAKGLGVDCIAHAFDQAGATDYMIEVGGEIALSGKNPQGQDWRIQIDAPIASDTLTHRRLTILSLSNCCIATSGNYRRFLNTSSGTISHTISPITGLPVSSSTLSATVIAPSCAMADALATACMAMPLHEALEMIDSISEAEAMLVYSSDVTNMLQFSIATSKGWPGSE